MNRWAVVQKVYVMEDAATAHGLEVSLTRACTYTVRNRPAQEDPAQENEMRKTEPSGVQKDLTPYELLMQEMAREGVDCYRLDNETFETLFPGGVLELSAEGLARSSSAEERPLGGTAPAAGSTSSNTSDDLASDLSPNGDDLTPDLGERVL